MAVSGIGDEAFIRLSNTNDPTGAPEIPQEFTACEMREGVSGVAVVKLGTKCEPFQMESCADVATLADAEQKRATYNSYVGEIKNLVWNGRNYTSDHNCRYVVLHVSNIRIKRCAVAVGGLLGSGSTRFLVYATWDLVAQEVSA